MMQFEIRTSPLQNSLQDNRTMATSSSDHKTKVRSMIYNHISTSRGTLGEDWSNRSPRGH